MTLVKFPGLVTMGGDGSAYALAVTLQLSIS